MFAANKPAVHSIRNLFKTKHAPTRTIGEPTIGSRTRLILPGFAGLVEIDTTSTAKVALFEGVL